MDDELRRVGLYHLTGVAFAEHMDEVGASFEGADGGKIRRSGVHVAAAKNPDSATLAFVHVGCQLRHNSTNFLLEHLVPIRLLLVMKAGGATDARGAPGGTSDPVTRGRLRRRGVVRGGRVRHGGGRGDGREVDLLEHRLRALLPLGTTRGFMAAAIVII